MTLYKGQTLTNVELLPGEHRDTLFTEKIRKQSYEAIKNRSVEPILLSELLTLANANSIQANKLLGKMVFDELVSIQTIIEVANNLETPDNPRGDAGPGFIGELRLGPYAIKPKIDFDETGSIGPTDDISTLDLYDNI